MLHSAPVAPFRGVFLTYSLRCLGFSSPWHRVLPRTIQSGGLGHAPLRPGCSNPGRLFDVFSPLPRTLQSVAPGSPPDDPVRGLVPCFIPPRLLQSGASFYRILSVASDAPVRGNGFPPRRSSLRAWAVLHSAPDAPIRGIFFLVISPLPRTLQSVAPGSPPEDPVRGLVPCFISPRLLHSGVSFYRSLSVASDAPVRGSGFSPGRSSPGAWAVLLPRSPPLRCPWHLVPCRGSSCVVRASRVRGTRWPLWLGTCPRPVVVAGGVPIWRASWPRVGAPLLVRSGRSRCSGRLSRRRCAFPQPGGCRPRLYWVAARGTLRPGREPGSCACRWPLPRQGRWARSASYPFGAPRWGCPWRVPPASVLGCVRCGGLPCGPGH